MNTIKDLQIKKANMLFLELPELILKPPHKKEIQQVPLEYLTLSSKHQKKVNKFLATTQPDFSYSRMNDTLLTLSIKSIPKTKKYQGDYDIEGNAIRIEKNSDAIYHELFHAFTRYNTKINIGTGFFRTLKTLDIEIGDGLNEGYTDLLSKQYFDSPISEAFTSNIALKTEMIIGRENMHHYYDHNDLQQVITYLASLSSKEEAKRFILGLDKLYKYKNNSQKGLTLWTTLSSYLTHLYIKQLEEQYKIVGLPQGEITDKLDRFKESFTKYTLKNKQLKKQYLASNEYQEIQHSLTYHTFTKQLHR